MTTDQKSTEEATRNSRLRRQMLAFILAMLVFNVTFAFVFIKARNDEQKTWKEFIRQVDTLCLRVEAATTKLQELQNADAPNPSPAVLPEEAGNAE